MKRRIKMMCALMLAVVMMASFVGCGDNQTADGVSKITIWSADEHSRLFYEQAVKDFNDTIGKEKGIEIEYTIMSDLQNQMDLALANGNAPDFIAGVTARKQAEEGNIVALNDIPGMEELIEKFKPFEQYNGFDDKVYQLPTGITTYGLVYNKDMFKAAGIVDENGEAKPPETVAELVEVAKKLTNPDENKYGIIFPGKWGTNWVESDIISIMQPSTGLKGFNPIDCTYDWTPLKPILEAFMQIQKDGSNMPGFYTLDNDMARARFAEGNIGMKFAASFDVGVYNDQFPAKCDWGVAPIPVVDANNKHLQAMQVGYGYCINAKTYQEKGPEKIAEVYKWLLSDEMKIALCSGGYAIPLTSDLIDKCDFSNAKKGWKEFVEMLEVSHISPQVHGFELEGNKNINALILEDVWTEKIGIDEALENATKYYNEGVKKRQEIMPEYDSSKFLKDSWDIKR